MNDEALQKKLYRLARRIARAQKDHGLFARGDRVLVALTAKRHLQRAGARTES